MSWWPLLQPVRSWYEGGGAGREGGRDWRQQCSRPSGFPGAACSLLFPIPSCADSATGLLHFVVILEAAGVWGHSVERAAACCSAPGVTYCSTPVLRLLSWPLWAAAKSPCHWPCPRPCRAAGVGAARPWQSPRPCPCPAESARPRPSPCLPQVWALQGPGRQHEGGEALGKSARSWAHARVAERPVGHRWTVFLACLPRDQAPSPAWPARAGPLAAHLAHPPLPPPLPSPLVCPPGAPTLLQGPRRVPEDRL